MPVCFGQRDRNGFAVCYLQGRILLCCCSTIIMEVHAFIWIRAWLSHPHGQHYRPILAHHRYININIVYVGWQGSEDMFEVIKKYCCHDIFWPSESTYKLFFNSKMSCPECILVTTLNQIKGFLSSMLTLCTSKCILFPFLFYNINIIVHSLRNSVSVGLQSESSAE